MSEGVVSFLCNRQDNPNPILIMCGMEIGALKKMLKKSTAVLILENGEPSIVVVDYNTYKELLNEEGQEVSKDQVFTNPTTPAQTGEVELLERINKDILALKEQIEEEEKGLGI